MTIKLLAFLSFLGSKLSNNTKNKMLNLSSAKFEIPSGAGNRGFYDVVCVFLSVWSDFM